MSIDSDDVLEGIELLSRIASKFGPAGKVIALGLDLTKDVVDAATTLRKDSVEMMVALKAHLRDTVTAELQKALDED